MLGDALKLFMMLQNNDIYEQLLANLYQTLIKN